jgi:hypothetical protein
MPLNMLGACLAFTLSSRMATARFDTEARAWTHTVPLRPNARREQATWQGTLERLVVLRCRSAIALGGLGGLCRQAQPEYHEGAKIKLQPLVAAAGPSKLNQQRSPFSVRVPWAHTVPLHPNARREQRRPGRGTLEHSVVLRCRSAIAFGGLGGLCRLA